jgi:tripartite-type tricarboxylate transporter receptor subunit TctC
LGAGRAFAQSYPTKAIRMIVPFPPGGATDAGGRILAEAISTRLKQPVVVDNLGGANGGIGAETVAKSRPDGYTLLFTSMGTLVMNPHLYHSLRLQPLRDLVPVAKVFDTPLVIEARPDRGFKAVDDLIARARSAPGKVTYSSGGIGASSHMAAELFQFHTRTQLNHIPYKGNGPALLDLLSGQVDVMFDQVASSQQHIVAGKLRALAVTSPKRLAALPDVPTVGELGYPELEMSSWASVTAAAGTPVDVVDVLSRAILAALQDPAVRERFEKAGAIVAPGDPQELRVLLKTETDRWGKVIKAAGITAD